MVRSVASPAYSSQSTQIDSFSRGSRITPQPQGSARAIHPAHALHRERTSGIQAFELAFPETQPVGRSVSALSWCHLAPAADDALAVVGFRC